MTVEPAASRRLPFSADVLRARAQGDTENIKLIAAFAEILVEKFSAVLGAMGEAPTKASLESASLENLGPQQQAEPGFDLETAFGLLNVWCLPERSFDGLLCEICLGGSGGFQASEEGERPPTLFERRLRNLAIEKLVQGCAEALSEVSDQPPLTVVPRARVAVRKIEQPLRCYKLRMLINVHDITCEFAMCFGFSATSKLLGGSQDQTQAVKAAATEVLDTTPFAIEVFLKPDTLDVRQILNLSEGEVLKLNIPVTAPVELQLNGQRLASGLVGHDGQRLRVRLLDDAAIGLEAQHHSISHPMKPAS